MVLSDDDDEESQLLLSRSGDTLRTSKKALVETRQLGEEVLRNLESDSEKIELLKRKQDRVRGNVDRAESHARTIERNAMLQLVFVCLVLCTAIFGFFLFLLIRSMVKM